MECINCDNAKTIIEQPEYLLFISQQNGVVLVKR